MTSSPSRLLRSEAVSWTRTLWGTAVQGHGPQRTPPSSPRDPSSLPGEAASQPRSVTSDSTQRHVPEKPGCQVSGGQEFSNSHTSPQPLQAGSVEVTRRSLSKDSEDSMPKPETHEQGGRECFCTRRVASSKSRNKAPSKSPSLKN